MKKKMCMFLAMSMILGLSACSAQSPQQTQQSGQPQPSGQTEQEQPAQEQEVTAEVSEGFQPALDPSSSSQINISGSYDNFEALEAEFDRFNEFYPNVELTYTKIDDYNNMVGTVLAGNDAPDIYVNYSWMYGREQYQASIDYAENLADPALGLDLSCIRSNIILKTDDGTLPMVPVFSNTYGMLVNNDLFEKEGLSVPTTYQDMVAVCDAFREKGYENPMMGFSNKETTSLFTVTIYPYFCETVADDPEAIEKLNALDPSAGEYMRPALEKIQQFMGDGCVDLNACAAIENNYDAVILRFFEGDIPMMICSGDAVSGTKKRESRSEAFIANPFSYSFAPVPISDNGLNFLDMPNLQFSVNKKSPDLDMANEFMRFLITTEELNEMAQQKGLLSPTKDLSFNAMYAAFGDVPKSRILSPEVFGLRDDAVTQLRQAAYRVATGSMTIDEAIAAFGTYTNE